MREGRIEDIKAAVSSELGIDYILVDKIVKAQFRELSRLISNGYVAKIKIKHLFSLTIRLRAINFKLRILLKALRREKLNKDWRAYDELRKQFYVLWLVRREYLETDYARILRKRVRYKNTYKEMGSDDYRSYILNNVITNEEY